MAVSFKAVPYTVSRACVLDMVAAVAEALAVPHTVVRLRCPCPPPKPAGGDNTEVAEALTLPSRLTPTALVTAAEKGVAVAVLAEVGGGRAVTVPLTKVSDMAEDVAVPLAVV